MIQLDILSGNQAGTTAVARRLPFRVGRAEGSSLVLNDDGIWDAHFDLEAVPGSEFILRPHPDALCLVNGERAEKATALRNGDIIEAGSVKLHFSLAPSSQRPQVGWEVLVWVALVALFVAQLALIYLILP